MSHNEDINTDQQVEQGLEAVAQLDTQQEQPQQPRENENDRNFRNLRDEATRLKRENEELRRYYQSMAQEKQKPQQEEEEDLGLQPNEFIEGKQLSKIYAQQRRELRALKEEIKSSQQQLTYQTIKSQFPDFEKVVNNDNIERLKVDHPEIVDMLNESQNIYTKAASAYKIIKNLGIYSEPASTADRNRIQNNMNKPKPVQSVQGSALSHANSFADEDLSAERKAQIWAEVSRFRSNRNVF